MTRFVRCKNIEGDVRLVAGSATCEARQEEQRFIEEATLFRDCVIARFRRNLQGLASFTLVELLVAMAVLSLLTLMLMGMLGSVTSVWQMDQGRNERRTVAQSVLERMTRDIGQAALPLSRTNTNSLNFVISPPWITKPQANTQSIFFQAPVATDGGTNGNLAVVGYFVQWVNGTPGTSTLTRVLINPSAPAGSGTDYKVYNGTPNAWLSDTLLGTYGAATSPSYAGLLAENVLGLWVQALDPEGNPISQTLPAGEVFDSRYPYTYYNFGLDISGNGNLTTNVASALPASVRIAIAVTDSRTAKQITTKPTYYAATGSGVWNDAQKFYTNLPSAIRKGTEIQTTTIPLANGPR